MSGPIEKFRKLYGAGPAHLLGIVASFAVITLAVSGWFEEPAVSLEYILIWFFAAILAHDMFLLPVYTLLDRLGTIHLPGRFAARRAGTSDHHFAWVYVRVPVLLSGLLLLVFGPEILGLGDHTFNVASGEHQHVYLTRYLWIVLALFVLSGLAYLLWGRSSKSGESAVSPDPLGSESRSAASPDPQV
jgi:hypothetical protein